MCLAGGQHESRDKASSRDMQANDDKESEQKSHAYNPSHTRLLLPLV